MADRLIGIRERKSEEVADWLTILLLDTLKHDGQRELSVAQLERFRVHARKRLHDAIGESFELAGDMLLQAVTEQTKLSDIAARLASLIKAKEDDDERLPF